MMTVREYTQRLDDALAFLNSVEFQNEYIDDFPFIQADYIKERHAMGEVDMWPNAQGEFGRTPTNPILVNETWGEITYLSRLVTTDGQRMIFHRLGSGAGALDIFELVSEEGTFYDRLFVDMYHRHCSKIAPTGYTLLKTLDGITGTSEYIDDFPDDVCGTLVRTAIKKFGAAVVSYSVANFDEERAAEFLERARE